VPFLRAASLWRPSLPHAASLDHSWRAFAIVDHANHLLVQSNLANWVHALTVIQSIKSASQ